MRAIKIISLFSSGEEVTRRKIADELGITPQAASRWIGAVSLELPITEEERASERGKPTIFYRLMGEI